MWRVHGIPRWMEVPDKPICLEPSGGVWIGRSQPSSSTKMETSNSGFSTGPGRHKCSLSDSEPLQSPKTTRNRTGQTNAVKNLGDYLPSLRTGVDSVVPGFSKCSWSWTSSVSTTEFQILGPHPRPTD